MNIRPTERRRVTQGIGKFLADNEKIKELVIEATGKDPYNEFTSWYFSYAKQISDILEALEAENSDRWLLTYVLIASLENEGEHERLRELIVRACPETLITTPKVEQQVERVLTNLQKLLTKPLPPDLRDELRLKRGRLQTIVQDTARLFAYKSLHESLHELQLKLTVGEVRRAALGEETEAHVAIRDARARAAQVTPLLGAGSADEKVELECITALDALGTQLEAASNHNVEGELIEQIRDVIQLHLIRLNVCVFGAARKLSLTAIVEDPPFDFEDKPEFEDLAYAVRDLKPTVLARALKHWMWQDAEKELPLIDALLDLPGEVTDETADQWHRFKSRIKWLAELDPEASWSADARTLADQISDAMVAAENRGNIKASREDYRKLVGRCFFAMGAMLKTDCAVLRKVDGPLNSILQELSHV